MLDDHFLINKGGRLSGPGLLQGFNLFSSLCTSRSVKYFLDRTSWGYLSEQVLVAVGLTDGMNMDEKWFANCLLISSPDFATVGPRCIVGGISLDLDFWLLRRTKRPLAYE